MNFKNLILYILIRIKKVFKIEINCFPGIKILNKF